MCFFLFWKQHIPECLLRILLVRAWIEESPKPWFCMVCQDTHHRSILVRCNRCEGWVLFRNCSGPTRLRNYSDRDYVESCCNIVVPSGSESTWSTSELSSVYGTLPHAPELQPLYQPITFLQFNCNILRDKIDDK